MVFLVIAIGIEYKYVIYHNLLISVLYFFEWNVDTLLPFSFFYPHHFKNTVVFKSPSHPLSTTLDGTLLCSSLRVGLLATNSVSLLLTMPIFPSFLKFILLVIEFTVDKSLIFEKYYATSCWSSCFLMRNSLLFKLVYPLKIPFFQKNFVFSFQIFIICLDTDLEGYVWVYTLYSFCFLNPEDYLSLNLGVFGHYFFEYSFYFTHSSCLEFQCCKC